MEKTHYNDEDISSNANMYDEDIAVYYLIRFIQAHESFRLAEIEAISRRLTGCDVGVVEYSATSPFCVVRFHPHPSSSSCGQSSWAEAQARLFASHSILSRSIHEIWGWGNGRDHTALHTDVRRRSGHLWERYGGADVSFKFGVDSYGHRRSEAEKRTVIDGFAYMGFQGRIDLVTPQVEMGVFEEWEVARRDDDVDHDDEEKGRDNIDITPCRGKPPRCQLKRTFLARHIAFSSRGFVEKHDLKKRPYISTTSMDAELALVTANLALAGAGKWFLDPFVGTGGFMVAAAELGALTLGSDIDGRSFRGKKGGSGVEKGVGANFARYGLGSLFGDCIVSDLTNTPFRGQFTPAVGGRWLDGIICDPPYGVREGLKVLGRRSDINSIHNASGSSTPLPPSTPRLIDGVPAYTLPGFIPPKRPYSFHRMLDDILDFAARTLVDGARIAFWMPSANENEFGEEEVTLIPSHRLLQLKHECVQRFNKWSRRLLVYERTAGEYGGLDRSDCLAEDNVDEEDDGHAVPKTGANGTTADDLNPFRKRYFQAFAGKAE